MKSAFKNIPELYRRVIFFVFLILSVTTIGTIGYLVIQPEYTFLEALLMTTITLSTVGYEEVKPLTTDTSIAFTIFLIVIGVATLGYGVSSIISIIVEGQIKNTFRYRKMEKAIAKLSGHVILCGHGRLGNHAADELEKWKKPCVIIEYNKEIAEDLQARNKLCIHGSAVEDSVLIKAGIARAKGLISALSHDTDNLFVALTARRLNPELLIISRVEYENSEVKLLSAGADKVLSPTHIAGRRMATMLVNPEVVNFLDVVNEASNVDLILQEFHIKKDSWLDDVQIKDCKLSRDIRIIGLKDTNGEMLVNPDSSTRLKAGQIMIILGEKTRIEEMKH